MLANNLDKHILRYFSPAGRYWHGSIRGCKIADGKFNVASGRSFVREASGFD